MKNSIIFGIAALALPLAFACKKKKDPSADGSTSGQTDKVRLEIAHNWGDTPFELNTDLINTENGDTLNFATFKYYVSNIRLKKADGSWWSQPESYFLLDLSNGTTPSVEISGVPFGEYTDIQYVLGVDSLRNVSGAQSGALSTSLGMFWSWNSGYIMLKAEGSSPNSEMGSFAFHLGGFSGTNSVLTIKNHNFGADALSVTGNGNCAVKLKAQPQKLWTNAGSVSSNSMIHMPGTNAKVMADDFHSSFEFVTINE